MKLGGALEFGSGFTEILGTIAVGKEQGMFFHAEGGLATGSGESGFEVGGGLGWELKNKLADKIELCPVVNVHALFGYAHTNSQGVFGGLAAGYPLSMSGNVGVTLTGAVLAGFDRSSVDSDFCGTHCSNTDFAMELDAGAGFVFNERISLVPMLRIPLTGGDVRFRVAVNFAMGSR